MTTITIKENSIEASGHTEHTLCNTISTLMWALCTCLIAIDAQEVSVIEGDAYHFVSYKPSKEADGIFQGFKKCFVDLSEQFPKNISVFLETGFETENISVL